MISLNDEKIPWQEGMTVADLLSGLHDPHDYAVVRVNGKYVSKLHFEEYRIKKRRGQSLNYELRPCHY
ncbi:MAG: thiamine biosynthesis protein ThiS [Deltaproteobacteria bacterium]|nr:thiamine biosynthesis protein ThiS [Deltaproteobacteria bacterium]